MSAKPVIAVPACRRILEPHPFHMVGEKYLTALIEAAGTVPWMVPPLGDGAVLDEILQRVDGVFLTGSYSNVEPHRYDGPPSRPGTLHDPERDSTVLPLVRGALERQMPLFAVCRGMQEVNVALGGTLHQHVEEVAGHHDHREPENAGLEIQYGPSHAIDIVSGGRLHAIAGRSKAMVNSLHGQGVQELAPGLTVEAFADDGLVEAFSVDGQPDFAIAVQWHPEWRVTDDPMSLALFRAFGDAARRFTAERPAREQTDSLLDALGTAGEA